MANSPVQLLRLGDQCLGDNGTSAESLELEDLGASVISLTPGDYEAGACVSALVEANEYPSLTDFTRRTRDLDDPERHRRPSIPRDERDRSLDEGSAIRVRDREAPPAKPDRGLRSTTELDAAT
jgi:hypothetical protein